MRIEASLVAATRCFLASAHCGPTPAAEATTHRVYRGRSAAPSASRVNDERGDVSHRTTLPSHQLSCTLVWGASSLFYRLRRSTTSAVMLSIEPRTWREDQRGGVWVKNGSVHVRVLCLTTRRSAGEGAFKLRLWYPSMHAPGKSGRT